MEPYCVNGVFGYYVGFGTGNMPTFIPLYGSAFYRRF